MENKIGVGNLFSLFGQSITYGINRTNEALIKSFSLKRYVYLGWLFFLASLGQMGIPNFNSGSNNFGRSSQSSAFFKESFDFIKDNVALVIVISIIIFIIFISFMLLLKYIGARYRMVWLRTLLKAPFFESYDKSSIHLGNSLFVFELVVQSIIIAILLISSIPLIIYLIALFPDISEILDSPGEEIIPVIILLLFVIFFVVIPVSIIFSMINTLTNDFVIPVMDSKGMRCYETWKLLYPFFKANFWSLFLYIISIGFCMGILNGLLSVLSFFIILPVGLFLAGFAILGWIIAGGWNPALLILYIPLGLFLAVSVWFIILLFMLPAGALRRYISYDMITKMKPDLFDLNDSLLLPEDKDFS
ncbi:MAG: hypothetical protein JXA60_10740 [Candidatus Coatesbacteria bacterium]|nr:hypothetical protein [Candidatus Coatesbacteria bacterium]